MFSWINTGAAFSMLFEKKMSFIMRIFFSDYIDCLTGEGYQIPTGVLPNVSGYVITEQHKCTTVLYANFIRVFILRVIHNQHLQNKKALENFPATKQGKFTRAFMREDGTTLV